MINIYLHMRGIFVLAWALLFAIAAGQTPEIAPELLTLARIKTTMADRLARQPNYTCVQQIERSHRRLPKRKFELHDVLRIEVALADGKELFAWPGSRKFEQSDLTEMISGGAIGTGDFALHARSVFESSAPRFNYVGKTEMRGHNAVQYNFVVPLISSGYHLKSNGREAVVGYHGSLWADVETHELVRLEVDADDIPPSLGIATAKDQMDYDRVRIGESDFLLPVGSELAMVDLTGNENRNRTQFKSCRQYTGESVLTFAEAPDSTAPEQADVPVVQAESRPVQTATKASVDFPVGTVFAVKLTSDVDSEVSAVGDPVRATLEESIKQKRQLLFPKGATLLGRIIKLERHGDFSTLDLQFSELESGDDRAALTARVEEMTTFTTNSFNRMMVRVDHQPEEGIRVRGNHIRLRAGTRLRLRSFALHQTAAK